MRRAAKVDANQTEIVQALRQIGCTVEHLHSVGRGCPDLLCGFRNNNYLLEVKDGSKPKSSRRLTPDQVVWHETWRGRVYVVENVEQAITVIQKG